MAARLKELYNNKIKAELVKEFGFKHTMQTPKIEKIVLNMRVGEATDDKKRIEGAVRDMTYISGQKPIIRKAKKSVASFKLREGMPIGVKVTLRNENMYQFLDRLITVALPRVKDFRGLNAKSFDGNGNYSFGITEQTIFPEIDYNKMDKIRGMDITIKTTAKNDKEGKALLDKFNFPFYNELKS